MKSISLREAFELTITMFQKIREQFDMAEEEIKCLRSVLSEWDEDKSHFVQMNRADDFAEKRKKIATE